jgi:hypothetical protein
VRFSAITLEIYIIAYNVPTGLLGQRRGEGSAGLEH